MSCWITHLDNGPQRVNHSAVSMGHNIYSFGGYCTGENYQLFRPIDVHVLNTISLRWRKITRNDWESDSVPFQRYGHTTVAYNYDAYLWGGRNDVKACNHLFAFDSTTNLWSRPKVTGSIPTARDGHAACVIEHFMYVFGGYEEKGERFSQDVFRLNLLTFCWDYVPANGLPPCWRDFHSASAIGNSIYVFGGRGDVQGPVHTIHELYCNQICRFDTITRTWSRPVTQGEIPEGRRSHTAFVYRNRLYIFGGYNGQMDIHYNDLYCYDPEVSTWTKLDIPGGPCPRRRHCACLVDSRVYIFGGTSPDPTAYPVLPFHNFMAFEGVDLRLKDHSDLHVLDFMPSLKMLCMLQVISLDLDQSILPKDVCAEISAITSSNNPAASRTLSNVG